MKNKTQSKLGQEGDQASGLNNGDVILRLGLDVHARQVTVAMPEEGGRIKVAGKMSHQVFANIKLSKNVP